MRTGGIGIDGQQLAAGARREIVPLRGSPSGAMGGRSNSLALGNGRGLESSSSLISARLLEQSAVRLSFLRLSSPMMTVKVLDHFMRDGEHTHGQFHAVADVGATIKSLHLRANRRLLDPKRLSNLVEFGASEN